MTNSILGPMGVMTGAGAAAGQPPQNLAQPAVKDVGAIAQKYRVPRNILMALEEGGEDPEAKAAEISNAIQQGKAIEDVVPYASLVRATDIADALEGVEPKGGLGTAIGVGVDNLQNAYGSALEGAGRSLGIDALADTGARIAENNAAEAASGSRGLTGMSDVDGLGSGASFVGETVAQQVPQLATTLGPVATGAAIGSVVPGIGTVAGGVAGGAAALAANIAQFYGFNRERQKEENDGEVNEGRAFATAIPQAGIDLASDALIMTPLGIGPKALQTGNMATRIMKGAGLGAISEAPTEAAQQAMERAQAGLDVTGPDARGEYVESAVAGGLVGGIFGGGRGALSRRSEDLPEYEAETQPESPLALPAPAMITPPPSRDGDADPVGDGSADGENAGTDVAPPTDVPAFDDIPEGAQIDVPDYDGGSWDIPSIDVDISTEDERGDMIRSGLNAMLQSTGLSESLDQYDYNDIYDDLNRNGGNVEDAIWWQLQRSAERAEQADWEPISDNEGAEGTGIDGPDAIGAEQPAIDSPAESAGPEGDQGRDGADAGQAEVIDAGDVTGSEPTKPVTGASQSVTDVTPTIENVRQKAAVLRGVPKETPPEVGNISLKWDAKENGFIFSRKHVDKVQAAVDAKGVNQTDAPVAAAAEETAPDPTPAQAEAENYKTGKAKWRGLDLSIENKKGSVRSKVGPDGKTAWSVTMPAHYGRILGTTGADGDHVDFYMGDDEGSEAVFVVDQIDPKTGSFDEHKVILGTKDEAEARKLYEGGFSDGSGASRMGAMTMWSAGDFDTQIKNPDRWKSPVGDIKAKAAESQAKPKPEPKVKPKLSSAADRPMKDLAAIDYETFDDKTREDGQNSPGKREGRSETGRWARATVKALKDAGFTPTMNAKGKPMKVVDFGYAMSHEPDETKIHLTAPNGVQFYAKIHKSVMSRDGVTILVQFTGEPKQKGYSRPFLGGNRYLDADLRPSEAAESIINWAERLDPKPKEVAARAPDPIAQDPSKPIDIKKVEPEDDFDRDMTDEMISVRADIRADKPVTVTGSSVTIGKNTITTSQYQSQLARVKSEQEFNDAMKDAVKANGTPKAATGLLSGLSEEKQARAAELKAKLAAKVRNQASSGIDPDYIILGGELVALYIEGGAKKFGQMLRDFADTTGLSMKEAQAPMRAAYNHVRDDMDLDGQDVSDMDSGDQVMAEVRAAIADEQKSSQNDASDPISEGEPSNEATNERDIERQDTSDDRPSVEGSEPDSEDDREGRPSGPERSGERSGPRDGEPSGDGDNVAGGLVGDGTERSGDEAAQPKGVSPGNFAIPDDFDLGAGKPAQKIADNIAAIQLIKSLQSENRHPTKDEQNTLARYVGWGGLKRVFDPKETGASNQWGRAQAELRDDLTPAQYRAAAYSTAHAHYTSRDVVSAMWGAMRGFGFEGGRALEPTVGTGNFLGLQPQDMAENTEWFAAELDDITGAIAGYLYPDATVFAGQGFENAPFRAGTIDVAIGNPPFGQDPLKSDLHPEIPPLSIHNYIIAKTGVLLRPGGIMGMVVTSRFLDTPNPQARSYLNEHFNFMGAVRLPNTAFKANAGTDVTTDIVWFQKRRDSDEQGDQTWLNTGVERDGVVMNGYFAANPDMMLGKPSMQGTMYGPDPEFTLESDGRNLPNAMRDAMAKIEGSLPDREKKLEDAVVAPVLTSDLAIGESLVTDDDKVMMRLDNDSNGNAVVEEITKDSPWGPITRELIEAQDAIAAAANAIKNESVEDAKLAIELATISIVNVGVLKEDGTVKKTGPTGTGKAVMSAMETIMEGLTDTEPYFGPAQNKALRSLKTALAAKKIGAQKLGALKGMLTLRRDTLALLSAEMNNDPKMEAKRQKLRRQYRAFVKKNGYVNDPANDALVGGLPGAEAALEGKYTKANKAQGIEASATEAAILSKRINTPYERATKADSAIDGIHISLRERGRLDLGLIADLTGKDIAAVTEELTAGDKPHVFYDPKRAEYVIADEYLSGNLAEKIKEARAQGAPENVSHLEAAMPEPKTAEQITPSIRSLWMPKDIFEDFLKDMGATSAKVVVNMKAAMIDISANGTPNDFGEQFKTERKSPYEIFESAVKGKSIIVSDRTHDGKSVKNERATQDANAAAERMSVEFQKWAYLNDERRTAIVDAFNEKMNVVVPRKFDGVSYLTQVGANPDIKLRNSQKNGAWRMMLSDSTLLHHVVGAGKTFTAITAIMERKRLGLSKKSLIAVPNHIVSQWAKDFYALYPGANILAATENDFKKENRRKLLARIATGDYDAVIIGHSNLKFIENNAEETQALMEEQLSGLEEALAEAKRSGASRSTVSQISSRVKKYKEKMDKLLEKLGGDSLGFDFTAMGVDNLVIDEAHEFKNLEYSTSGDRLVGMNNPDGSQRALDLYIKTRGLMGRKGAVGFLTGTPVSNSLVEIYTIMKYMVPDTMKDMGLMQYDSWASSFVQSKIRFEYTAAQKLKERNVLAGLNNLGPLSDLYRSFADIVMRKDVEGMYQDQMEAENKAKGTNLPTRFPTPKVKGGSRRLVSLPSSPDQDEFTDYLVMRMSGIQNNKSDRDYASRDNALWVLQDARKASIDIRTVDPTAQRHEASKVVAAGQNILRIANATEGDLGTQLVFSDSSVPTKAASKSVKVAIKSAWMKAGLTTKEATDRINKDVASQKKWSQQWGDVVEAIETRFESGDLTAKQQESIEEWMNGEDAADGAAVAFTADTGFSFYDDLKAYLVEQGMAPDEVVFIHDYKTADEKSGLFEAFNAGKIRVLIGSTFKMGAGTNAQRRLVGLHHVDAPWRPSDMEQREGRIIRQGNALYEADPENFEVEILAYTTEKTSDVVLWQVLERKAAGIEQFLDATADNLIEDEASDADGYAAFMAQSTGNPVFLRKMETEKAVRDKESEQSSIRMVVSEARRFMEAYDGRMDNEKRQQEALKAINFDAYPDAGSSFKAHQKAVRAYEQAKADHKVAADKVRTANKKLAKGEKRKKLPEFDMAPPVMFEQGNLDAYSKRVKDAMREAMDDGSSSKIKIGNGWLQILRTPTTAEGVYAYVVDFSVKGQEYLGGYLGDRSVVKNPFNSRALLSALSPENVMDQVSYLTRRSERSVSRMEEIKPEMDRKSKIQVDRKEINKLKRDLEMYAGLVRVAEVRNAQARLGKINRFAVMDTKGRDLELKTSDDAPLLPDDGSEFIFENGGHTYRSSLGAKGADITRDGETTSFYWFEAVADDGTPALVQASRTTKAKASGDAADATPPALEVQDVFDMQEMAAKGVELRGMGGTTDPDVSQDDIRHITRDMNAELERTGLSGKVSMRVVKKLLSETTGQPILGRFQQGQGISVSADADSIGIMRHEIIHALRSEGLWNKPYGLFTGDEWRGLVRAARAAGDIAESVKARYPDLPTLNQTEEMVAELYRLWAADRDGQSGVQKAFAKVEAFLMSLANLLRGRGFQSAAMTMDRIASGKVGGRGPDGPQGSTVTNSSNSGAEMRAPAGAVRDKFKGLVGSTHWKDPGTFISNKLSDAMAGNGDYSLLALVPGRPLFKELGKRLIAAQTYLKHKEDMDQSRNEWHSRADNVSQDWLKARNVNPRANDDLMDLMHRSTLAQIDPTAEYDGGDANLAKKQVAQKGDNAPRWAKDKVSEEARRKKTHGVLRRMYDKLPPEFQKLYKSVQAEYNQMGDDFEAAVIENVKNSMRVALKRARKEHKKALRSIKDDGLTGRERDQARAEADEALQKAESRNDKGAASKLQSLREQFESGRLKGPYFPLARFGQYFVTVRDDNGEVTSFSQFETEAEQAAHVKAMEKENPGMVRYGLMENKGALKDQVNPTFVADVEGMLADADVSPDVLDAIWQKWLSTMPDQSIRTTKIHRKGRAGWNQDAFRAFGKHMFHGAHQLARLRYGVLLEETLDDARDEARVSENPNRAGALVNEMEKRHEFTMNPTGSSAVASMSSLAFVWYLGATPAAAIVNISQTTVVGTPIMAAKFRKAGVKGSLAAIAKAGKDFGRGKGFVENSDRLTSDEQSAMREAYRRGTVDKTQAHDLASVAETGIEYNATREKWMRKIGWMFHNAERMNREITFLANYRLAREEGLDHAQAIDLGADMTWKIHFDYQNTARPRFMQNDLGKILTTFRQFTVNMMYRMFRDAHQALNGATQEDRREARAQLVGISLSMMAHAGIKGTWGYGILMGLLALFTPGDSDDLEDWMQDALLMEGDDPGTAAWNFAMGMALNGVPGHITGANLTERLGMPNLWFRGPGREMEGRDLYAHYVKEMLGPVYGVGEGIVRGAFAISEGEVMRGAESMVPKFIRDPLKTGRYAVEGVQTWNGDPIVEEPNPWELLLQANGFTPSRVAERYDINNRLKNRERKVLDERKDLHRSAGDAIRGGNAIPQEVMADIRDFNSRFPEYPITGQTIRQSVRGRIRASENNEFGVSLNKKLNARLRSEVARPVYN